ncbi:hypothetical protein [Luteipulveratus mongoliensis]|uniref:Uncharacterized protein n=1 Tax=Luteipulveratus mongoliensis TaxID=571913 RepID=A0A0K1JEM1_9MICO|nr:hypothetical protein [Luteipulveratus mongoliensis]AKU15040.1 hypothetical protein VV02_02820 [Luteipulveratus mongoliensis]
MSQTEDHESDLRRALDALNETDTSKAREALEALAHASGASSGLSHSAVARVALWGARSRGRAA